MKLCFRVAVALTGALLLFASRPASAAVVAVPEVELAWTPASGPVAAYAVWVARNDSGFSADPTHAAPWGRYPRFQLRGEPGDVVRIRVAAVTTRGRIGPLSPPSEPIEFVAPEDAERIDLGTHGIAPGAFADFDGDGTPDVATLDPLTGEVTISLLDALGVRDRAVIGALSDGTWEIQGLGDFDADGRTDLLFRQEETGIATLWLTRGLEPAPSFLLSAPASPEWTIAAIGEFNGDRRADLVWQHRASGRTAVWLMDGPRVVTQAMLPAADPSWEIAGVGDWGEGRPSALLWRNSSSGQNIVWIMRGATVSIQAWLPPEPDVAWRVAALLDLDADGQTEIVWRHAASGSHRVWFMRGVERSAQQSLSTPDDDGRWHVAAGADLDDDGQADLLWFDALHGRHRIALLQGLASRSVIRVFP